MRSLVSLIFASAASAALSGSQKITTHNYQEVAGALDTNPVFCGYPGSQLDITRITAVQGLTKDQCGACLQICNGEDKSKCQYVMAVDRGGVGLDLNTASFQALFNDYTGLYHAEWNQVDSSFCSGIHRNGAQYEVKNAPPVTIKPPTAAKYAVQTTTNPPIVPTTTTTDTYIVQTTTSNLPVIPTTTNAYAVQTTTSNPPVILTTTNAYVVQTTTTTTTTTNSPVVPATTTTESYPVTTTTDAYPVKSTITTTTVVYPVQSSTTTTDVYPVKSTTTVTPPTYPTVVPQKAKCHRRKTVS